MKLKMILLMVFYLVSNRMFANEDKEIHRHRNEISIAGGGVPLVTEDEVTAGLHIHYIKGIGNSRRLGLGLALETIFDKHRHYTSSVVFQYRMARGLAISYSPGFLIRKEEADYQHQFASHIEAAYEVELGEFHIGPVAELGVEKNGIHYMGGVHFGIDI